MSSDMKYDLCIIGGAGHVGLPLSVAFAHAGVRTFFETLPKIKFNESIL